MSTKSICIGCTRDYRSADDCYGSTLCVKEIKQLQAELDKAKAENKELQGRVDCEDCPYDKTVKAWADEKKKLQAELDRVKWYLRPESDTETSPHKGKGQTWIQYAKEEFKRAEQLQAENEMLKEALTQMDNNAFAIRLTYEHALQGKKGSEE